MHLSAFYRLQNPNEAYYCRQNRQVFPLWQCIYRACLSYLFEACPPFAPPGLGRSGGPHSPRTRRFYDLVPLYLSPLALLAGGIFCRVIATLTYVVLPLW